jgi:hypothetical protein
MRAAMTEQEKIMKKISDLIAKAERTEFEAEKDSYWTKAHELLDKYAIDLADLRRTNAQAVTLVHKGTSLDKISTTPGYWFKPLAGAIATYVGVQGIHWKGDQNIHVIYIGSENQVDIALFMFMNLVVRLLGDCDRATRIAVKEGRINDSGKKGVHRGEPHRKTWRSAFMQEACNSLGQRLLRIARERDANSSAIVVFSKSEIDQFLKESFGEVEPGKPLRAGALAKDARLAGRKAGEDIELQQGLEGGNKTVRDTLGRGE